jgi:phenylalanyl-tRNA synthetase alpha chain
MTGAYVRAARSAQIAISQRAPSSAIRPSSGSYAARWQSTQAQPHDEPADHTRETYLPIGQAKAAKNNTKPVTVTNPERVNDETTSIRRSFRSYLQNSSPNTIVERDGLTGAKVSQDGFIFDSTTNLSSSILDLIDRGLHKQPNHPLNITRRLIEEVFQSPEFIHYDFPDPVVSVKDNFDDLGFPQDHPGRSRTDTYYVDAKNVLRTHTSAHQNYAFKDIQQNGDYGFTICADVYRRDSIDRSHFPVFHQMEGARCWMLASNIPSRYEAMTKRQDKIIRDLQRLPKHTLEIVEDAPSFDLKTNPPQLEHDEYEVELMVAHLKRMLELLIQRVFTAAVKAGVGGKEMEGKPLQVRWVEAYFPFTSPSFELEVQWQGEWLELLGCGIVQQPILRRNGLKNSIGWAWGLGVERLAMLLFGIPDIRLFWSEDQRFLSQFKAGQISKFEPFSKYPACYKDVAFWVPAAPASASPLGAKPDSGVAAAAGGDSTKASPAEVHSSAFHENDVMEVVRNVGGTLVEDVKLVDEFLHPKSNRKSLCYRINYRSLERTLTNEEVNELHSQITGQLTNELGVELR